MSRATHLACIFVLCAAGAQNVAIQSNVKEVLVPVVVTDRRGHHITGLKQSDFEVFEDDKAERIVSFRVEDAGSAPPSIDASGPRGGAPGQHSAAPNADAPRRTYLIIVDTLHSSFANFAGVREALRRFFEKEQSGDAQYAVFAIGRDIRVVQDSTRDPSAVLASVRNDRIAATILDSEAGNLAAEADRFTALMRQYCSVCACESTGQTSDRPECPAAKSKVQAYLTSFSERTFVLNRRFLADLAEMVKASATMPTSRTVIFISDGFNRFPGRELYAIMDGYSPRDRSFEFNTRDNQPDLDGVLQLATKNNVKFYTIDSRGVYTLASVPGSGFDASSSSATPVQMDSRRSANLAAGVPEAAASKVSSAARESADPLALLARETGGLFYENNNDLLKGLRQAVADGREYYVLAYAPDNAADDGTYRKIRIVVRNPKWRVNAKAGYWAK